MIIVKEDGRLHLLRMLERFDGTMTHVNGRWLVSCGDCTYQIDGPITHEAAHEAWEHIVATALECIKAERELRRLQAIGQMPRTHVQAMALAKGANG